MADRSPWLKPETLRGELVKTDEELLTARNTVHVLREDTSISY
jgi:hypothetical protein